MLREARGRKKRRWCRSNNVAPTKKKEPKICNRYVANKGRGGGGSGELSDAATQKTLHGFQVRTPGEKTCSQQTGQNERVENTTERGK